MAAKPATAKVPVALPKGESVSSTLVSQDVSLQMAIGARIRVTINSASIEGTIYTADPVTNLLVLNMSPSNSTTAITASSLTAPPGAYRILPISQISSFQLLTLPPPSSPSSTTNNTIPSSNQLDPAALQARLTRSLNQAQAVLSRQGPKGTTPTDQALFDALSRTHPARWSDNIMVISDTFAIEKPYNATNVRFLDAVKGHGDLERMKKVVDMARTKVLLRMGKGEIDGRMGANAGARSGASTMAASDGNVKKGG